MSFGHFSKIISPTRRAHKGAQTPPLCELLAYKSHVGLGLEASDRQRFARIQIARKKQDLGANLSKLYVQ